MWDKEVDEDRDKKNLWELSYGERRRNIEEKKIIELIIKIRRGREIGSLWGVWGEREGYLGN